MLMTLMLKFLYPWPKDTSEFQSHGSGSVFFAENILTVVIIIGHDGDFVGAGIVKRSDNRVDFFLAEFVQFGRTFGKTISLLTFSASATGLAANAPLTGTRGSAFFRQQPALRRRADFHQIRPLREQPAREKPFRPAQALRF